MDKRNDGHFQRAGFALESDVLEGEYWQYFFFFLTKKHMHLDASSATPAH